MEKRELVFLHGLMAEVRRFCEESSGEPMDLEWYEKEGVGPEAIHKTKEEHKESIFGLLRGITDDLGYGMNGELPESSMKDAYKDIAKISEPEAGDRLHADLGDVYSVLSKTHNCPKSFLDDLEGEGYLELYRGNTGYDGRDRGRVVLRRSVVEELEADGGEITSWHTE